MYTDPTTLEKFNCALHFSCNTKRQIVIALDLDNDEYHVLTPKPVIRATLLLFEL